MNKKEAIVSTFNKLTPGSRHIGIFNQQTGTWCRASLIDINNRHCRLNCEGLQAYAPTQVFLCQLAFSFSRRYSFFAKININNDRIEFNLPEFLLPITVSRNEGDSKRENYRVKPTEDNSRVEFYPINGSATALSGHLTDVSAGGLGLSVDAKTLQIMGNDDMFTIYFDTSLGIVIDKIDDISSEQLEIVATLKNARPLPNNRINLGFSFHAENNPNLDFKNVTQKLLNYVASRQRQILQKRITTKNEN